MSEIDFDTELGLVLKGLLTSKVADDLSGDIKAQNKAFSENSHIVEELTDDDAPLGFPVLPDAGSMGVLQYLNKHRILTFEEQLHLAADNLSDRGYRKINQSTRKRLSKVWKGCYEGKTRELETLLTQMLLHPNTRCRLVGDLSVQANWRRDPIVKMLIAAHGWLGYGNNADTVKGFIEHYQTTARYWPLEIWETIAVDEYGRQYEHGTQLANAIEGFLLKLKASASDWESLNERERKGILLGLYAASSLMETRVVVAPFAELIPNLDDYLDFKHLPLFGIGDESGEPTPLFMLASSLAKHIKPNAGLSHGELIFTSIKAITQTLGADLGQLDMLKMSLRDYFSGRLAECLRDIALTFNNTQNTFKDDKSPYGLSSECEEFLGKVQGSIEMWFDRLLILNVLDGNRVSSQAGLSAENYDYWVTQFMAVLKVNSYKQTFEQYLAKNELDIEAIQLRAQEAVKTMDTVTLVEVTNQMAEAKVTAEKLLLEFYRPLVISDLQRANEPCSGLAVIDKEEEEEEETSSDGQLLDGMELVITDLESQLEDERRKSSELGKSLASSRDEVRDLTEALEEDSDFECDAYTTLLRNSSPVAVVEAFKGLAGNHVVVLDEAIASAKKSAFKNTAKLMEYLTILSEDYYKQIVVEGKPDAVARKALGMAYRAGESDQTMAVQKLRAQREFKYNGETVAFTQHLTLGTKRGDQATIQVHFKIIDKKLIIARVGTHLDVASS